MIVIGGAGLPPPMPAAIEVKPRQPGSPIGGVERDVPRDRALPAVAVREQALLVVVELLGSLGRELDVRSQDDSVNGAGLLAEAAVDAFHHIDVEAGGPPRAHGDARQSIRADLLR